MGKRPIEESAAGGELPGATGLEPATKILKMDKPVEKTMTVPR